MPNGFKLPLLNLSKCQMVLNCLAEPQQMPNGFKLPLLNLSKCQMVFRSRFWKKGIADRPITRGAGSRPTGKKSCCWWSKLTIFSFSSKTIFYICSLIKNPFF
jgi:hypothetical protein